MEQNIGKFVDFGIGAVQAMSETLNQVFAKMQSQVKEVATKGEKASDKTSLKIREVATRIAGYFKSGEKKPVAKKAAV